MKKKFVFDASENDIINIDEKTVIKDTGVKTENVKKEVMKTVRTAPKPVRIIRKKTVISLIAAAAAIAVLGTVTVGAAGGFNQTFSEFFAGEPANGVYSGSNVSLNSDKVNIDFIGIAGDDDHVMGMMTLNKKDGSSFVDTTENTFIETFNINEENTNYVQIEQSLWDELFHSYGSNTGSITYSLRDKNTLCAMIEYVDDRCDLKGSRLTAKAGKIYAYTPVKTIYTPEIGDGYSQYVRDENGSHWEFTDTIIDDMNKKYNSELKEDQIIRYSENMDSIIIAAKKEIQLDFEVGVTLNYKSTTRSFESAHDKKYMINDSEWTVDYINAKSFAIELSSHSWELENNTQFDIENIENWDEETLKDFDTYNRSFLPELLTVTLKNGKQYKAVPSHVGYTSGYSIDDHSGDVYLKFDYTDENGNIAAVDPEQIVSVTYEGQALI